MMGYVTSYRQVNEPGFFFDRVHTEPYQERVQVVGETSTHYVVRQPNIPAFLQTPGRKVLKSEFIPEVAVPRKGGES